MSLSLSLSFSLSSRLGRLFSSPLFFFLSLSLPLSCTLQLCIRIAKGTGLDDSAGKEDPVELDSNLTL